MLQGDRRQLVASKYKLIITYAAQKMRKSNLPVKIFHRENWDDRGETCLTVMSEHSLESLSNDQGDVNETGKKVIGLDWQNVHHAFLYISLPSLHDHEGKYLISRFLEDVNPRQQLSFSFPEL